MRMALDLGLHRALEKLADSNTSALTSNASDASGGRKRSDEEERDLGMCTCLRNGSLWVTNADLSSL